MSARVVTLAFSGVEAVRVDVEVQLTGGDVAFILVGLGDKAVGRAASACGRPSRAWGCRFLPAG
jgi:hypothetical protein